MKRPGSAASPRIDRDRFIAMLRERFPEVSAEISDVSEGLVHLEMATLQRATNAAIRAGDLDLVRRHFEFVDELFRTAIDEFENALNVSYLEGLDFRGPHSAAAKKLLRPRLRTELDAQNAYIERLFGKPTPPKRKPRKLRGPR